MEAQAAPDAADWEEKRLPRGIQLQSADEQGNFSGLGAVFDELHPTSSWSLDGDWQDRVRPGAFKATLAGRARLPSMLYMHERGNVIGTWSSMEETKAGLQVSGQVSLKALTPSGVPIYELMKTGGISGMSIGFRVVKSQLDEKAKVRDILAVDLGELSVVDEPGIDGARISDVKARDPRTKHFLETVLRDAGLSRKEAKALLADGFDALRDAGANDETTQRDADRPGDSNAELAALIRGLANTIRP